MKKDILPGRMIRTINAILTRKMEAMLQGECGARVSDVNGYILGYLYDHQNKTVYQKDIEEELGLTKGTVSKVLDTMEKHSYIKRLSDSADGRYRKIVISDEGKELAASVKAKIDDFEIKTLQGLDEDDLICLNKCLSVIKKNLESC